MERPPLARYQISFSGQESQASYSRTAGLFKENLAKSVVILRLQAVLVSLQQSQRDVTMADLLLELGAPKAAA